MRERRLSLPDVERGKNIYPMSSVSTVETIAPGTPLRPAKQHTYGRILKSSALIGGSSVLSIAIGIVRTKAMAVLLGPSGIGLMGLYSSVADLAQSIAGMGINSSGVRQIAEAVGSGETERIARTVVVLRRISVFLGTLGALLLIAFSKPVSMATFGSDQYAGGLILLSLAVLFRSVTAGQGALIQGMRRISDMAKMGVLGALFGTVISIPLVYFLREKGVVPSLVGVAAMATLTSWWYSHKVQVQAPSLTISQVWREASALLSLGFAFMASGLLTLGAAYAIRIIVLRQIGFEAAGLYQSAWTLGGLYVGFILQAMGADFYPRLTAIAKDNTECNHLVNEQALVGMLIAAPGVIATLTFAPLVIALFYSAKFNGAVEPLRWICLGMVLRVVAWPMGFIVLAKNAQKIFFLTEVAAATVHVGLALIFIAYFGLAGATMAFFGLYVWHGILIYVIVRWMSGFRWSAVNRRTGLLFLPLIGVVFGGFYLFPFWVAATIGILATLSSGVYSIRVLATLVTADEMPGPVQWLLTRFGFASAASKGPTND
jgi:PST family polysaccharide transporter